MKSNFKITLLVSIQIILILASFLTLSYFESESQKFENSISIAIHIRHFTDSLIFETERYQNDVPYADPQYMIKEMQFSFDMIKSGGILNEHPIKPLPPKFIDAYNVAIEKSTIFTNHVEKILEDGHLDIDFTNNEFVTLDTEKFDSHGSLNYLISIMMEESKIQSNNIIILEIGLAILNVGIHVLMIIFISDILRKQSEKEIKLEKLAAIGALAARLAHDLRNPLAVLKGGMELLTSNEISFTEKQSAERVKMMKTAMSRMTHQLEDVMDFVRTSKLSLEKTSILGIIQSAIKRVSVPDSVDLTCTDSDYTLNCDKVKLEIVFVNLLSNALDAIHNDGKIQIRMKRNDKFLEIELEDSGNGIAEKSLSHVFEPLFTLKQKGTGLGLASCKSIVEQHGGTISVTNNPTVFLIKLDTDL